MLLPILRSPKKYFFRKKMMIWGKPEQDVTPVEAARPARCGFRSRWVVGILVQPLSARRLASRCTAEYPNLSVFFPLNKGICCVHMISGCFQQLILIFESFRRKR